MSLSGDEGQLGEGNGANGEQIAAVAGELGVPEGELVLSGEPFADALEEVVSLGDDTFQAGAGGDLATLPLR